MREHEDEQIQEREAENGAKEHESDDFSANILDKSVQTGVKTSSSANSSNQDASMT